MPARLEQPCIARRVQHAGQQALRHVTAQQPAVELAAGCGRSRGRPGRGRAGIPVDPCPDRLRRLAAAQSVVELQQRDKGQAPGSVGWLAALGVRGRQGLRRRTRRRFRSMRFRTRAAKGRRFRVAACWDRMLCGAGRLRSRRCAPALRFTCRSRCLARRQAGHKRVRRAGPRHHERTVRSDLPGAGGPLQHGRSIHDVRCALSSRKKQHPIEHRHSPQPRPLFASPGEKSRVDARRSVTAVTNRSHSYAVSPERRVQQAHRQGPATEQGRKFYAQRQGIEGTISQGVRGCGLRRARFRSLAKTGVQGVAAAAAINFDRLAAWFAERPLAPTRVSRFAAVAA